MNIWQDTLGFSQPPQKTRLVVAMSGGVDSAVAASLLAKAGYEVIGITLRLYSGDGPSKKGSCCAGRDIEDAKNVADKVGFSHYVLNYERHFQEAVIDDFKESYFKGHTPVPCIRCNERVKFQDLLKAAKNLGAKALVTGPYVQRIVKNNKAQLHQACDPQKDQSYFLFTTTQEQLDYLRFPLGGLQKHETRWYASHFGLSLWDKQDSQDICFVSKTYTKLLEQLHPQKMIPGEIVHIDGRVLGAHHGIANYTIGQRKGIRTPVNEALFVVGIDAPSNRIVVGPQKALACHGVVLNQVNWLGDERNVSENPVHVKIRSSGEALPATLVFHGSQNEAKVVFESPQYGVAPGQACVFYKGSRVLGGGWIQEAPCDVVPCGRVSASGLDKNIQ